MPSTSETGHAMNVANFEDLISFVTAYGAKYNPAKANLKVAALNTQLTTSRSILDTCKSTNNTFERTTNDRQAAFKPIKAFATRIVNALEAAGATDATIADARGYNNKIQGNSKKAKAKEEKPTTDANGNPPAEGTNGTAAPAPAKKSISTSQQSYDRLIDHLQGLNDLLKKEPGYQPNEAELKTSGIDAVLTTLRTTNTAVINAYTAYSNANNARDTAFYSAPNNLLETVNDVKKYVKSLYGATSKEYKQVSGIKFKTIKNK